MNLSQIFVICSYGFWAVQIAFLQYLLVLADRSLMY